MLTKHIFNPLFVTMTHTVWTEGLYGIWHCWELSNKRAIWSNNRLILSFQFVKGLFSYIGLSQLKIYIFLSLNSVKSAWGLFCSMCLYPGALAGQEAHLGLVPFSREADRCDGSECGLALQQAWGENPASSELVLTTPLWVNRLYSAHFTGKQSEAQRGWSSCPRSHRGMETWSQNSAIDVPGSGAHPLTSPCPSAPAR